MAASKETVYIKADRNVEVTDPCVKLGDILSMECANPTVLPKLKTINFCGFMELIKKTQNRVAVSILKLSNVYMQNIRRLKSRIWVSRTLSSLMRNSKAWVVSGTF